MMTHYAVSLKGENFWLELDGRPSIMGFFTTQYVVAENESEAESNAVQMLRDDPTLKNILNDKSDLPMIYCEDIQTVDAFEPSTVVQQGYAFYPEESDS